MQTVRTIEQTARQREALVALGTLAAGLAHEINNPASAATRAADALRETTVRLKDALLRLAEAGLTAEQYVALDALRERAGAHQPGRRPVGAGRPRGRAERLAHRPRRRRGLAGRARAGRRRGRRGLVREGRGPPGRAVPGPGAALAVQRVVDGRPAGRGQGVDAAGVGPGRRGPVVLAARPRLDPAHRRRRGSGEHAVGARQPAQGRDGRPRPRRRRPGDRGVRRASSTRCGPTSSTTRSTRWTARGPCASPVARPSRESSWRSPTAAPGCRPTSSRTCSSRSSRPRTSAAAPGLGLDISRRIIVERHAGDIAIERQDGQTVFRVTLPGPRR